MPVHAPDMFLMLCLKSIRARISSIVNFTMAPGASEAAHAGDYSFSFILEP